MPDLEASPGAMKDDCTSVEHVRNQATNTQSESFGLEPERAGPQVKVKKNVSPIKRTVK